jgi:hypothetical protein
MEYNEENKLKNKKKYVNLQKRIGEKQEARSRDLV